MANEDVTIPPNITTLSVAEAEALCDRLYSRSQSLLFVASPEVRKDMCLASRAIRNLICLVDKLADRAADESYRLRTMRIDVRGCE